MAKQAVSQNASKVYIGAAIDLPLLLSSRRQFKRLCRCSPQRKENRASRLFRSEHALILQRVSRLARPVLAIPTGKAAQAASHTPPDGTGNTSRRFDPVVCYHVREQTKGRGPLVLFGGVSMHKCICIVTRAWFVFVCGAVLVAAIVSTAQAAKEKGKAMSYGEAREFLAKRTKVIELTNDDGARVAVTPEWQGRVMTSTCDGPDGTSFGFINRKYIHENIDAGKENPHFNNIGAEERLWLCPEGGQYSLWFKHGAKQELANWFTPPAFNVGAWKVVTAATKDSVEMAVPMKFENTAETHLLARRQPQGTLAVGG